MNVIRKANALMWPIGGGVNIKPRTALAQDHLLQDEQGELQEAREQVKLDGLPQDRWWWD